MNHGQKWGWRAAAVKLLVAPVVAAGVVAGMTPPAHAQTKEAMPRAAATQPAARSSDPKEVLKQGREALKAGQLDKALDLAKRADATNATGRWGLFDDTPESLEKDIATARGKAGKVEAEKLSKAAKELYGKAAKTPGERLANLDQAYAMADKAVTLAGPTDFFGDVFGSGDRPEKLKKEVDAARATLRKSNPGVVSQALAKPATTGVQQAVGTARPTDAGRVVPVGGVTPGTIPAPKIPSPSAVTALTSPKADAAKLVADGRTLLRAGRVLEAKAKAADAAKLNAAFTATEDSPDALTRDCLADGKTKVDALVKEAEARVASKDFAAAEAKLTGAGQLASSMGFSSRPIDDRLAAVRTMSSAPTVVAVAPMPAAPVTLPAAPPMPTPVAVGGLTVPTLATPPAAAPVVVTPVVVAVAPTPDAVGLTMPVMPTVPAAPVALAPSPVAVPPVAAIVPAVPVIPGVLSGAQLLEQARASLRSNDIEMARKLAVQALNAGSKDEAQAVLREIDAESYSKQRKEAVASFTNAVGLVQIKQYDQALMAFKLIDADALTADQKARYADMVGQCEGEIAKLKAAATPVTVVAMQEPKAPAAVATPNAAVPAPTNNGVTTPVAQGALVPSDGGLTGQVKALADADYQKLRSEGLEAESKARAAYDRGETDLAIQMLTDFTAKVKASKMTESRQFNLLQSVERRLTGFRVMKRQTDFYTNEAKTKDDNRSRVAGKQLAEQQKQDDIKRKVAEVNELSKKKQYRQAEELALQVKTLDPDDASLNAIYELTKRQRRVEDYATIKGNKEAAVLGLLNEAEKFGQVPTDGQPLLVDQQRMMLGRLRGDGNNLYAKPLSQAEREIEVRLERPITVEFTNDVTLLDAIANIRTKTGLNITTDSAALAEDPTALTKTLVNESLKDLSLRNVLTILLSKANLKFIVEHDVITITTEKRARGKLVTKVFSVMELVTPIPDFALAPHQSLAKALSGGGPAPAWVASNAGASSYSPTGGMKSGELVSGGTMPGTNAPGPNGGTLQNYTMTPLESSATIARGGRSNHSEHLMRVIQTMVKPNSWDAMGGAGRLQYYDIGGALVINQTADVIADVQALLESLRRLQEVSVSVEVRVMSLSESFFERIGVDFAMNIKTKHRGQFEQSLTTGQFRPEPFINSVDTNNAVVGYNPTAGGYTSDLNVPVRTNSFGLGVPAFGGYPGPGNGGLGLGLAFLNDIQVFLFMEAAAGDRRVSTMQAPKITLFNGQTASIFVGDVSFFTTGLDVINVGGQFVYIPRNTPIPIGSQTPLAAQTTLPGISIAVQAIVSSDRRFVRLNLTPTLSSLTSATVPLFPVTAFITPVFEGGSQGVPIPFTQFFQQPQITEINVQTTVSCPDGGTVVLGGLKTLSEGRNEFGPPVLSQIPYINRLFRNQGIGRETRHIMIMVTPRIIIQSEEELNQTGSVTGAAPGL